MATKLVHICDPDNTDVPLDLFITWGRSAASGSNQSQPADQSNQENSEDAKPVTTNQGQTQTKKGGN